MTSADVRREEAAGKEHPTFKSFNPATGSLLGTFPIHSAADVASAVLVAREASRTWQELGFDGRRAALARWARHTARNLEDLVTLVHAENGKTRADATAEIFIALELIRWTSRNAQRVLGPQKVASGLLSFNHSALLEYRPYGVVGVIGPWNYPVFTPMGSIACALAAGNAVVFKPSEITPAIGQWVVDAFEAANPELPRGILTLVTGMGDTGAALCRSGVDKIAFTGSSATGRKIAATCAEKLTPVVLECGGKDVMIVADDADVPAAARMAAWAGLLNSGQTCIGLESVYVTESVRQEFLTCLKAEVAKAKPGVGPDATYGPMTLPGQLDVVSRHVTEALAAGATAVVGGLHSIRAPFIEPIVLVDVPDDNAAACEETFGPTIVVRTVADVDEAIALVNRHDYALGSSVYSRHHGLDIARRLRPAQTAVNAAITFGTMPALPFGGNGASGYGRIHGDAGLREFATTKAITERRFTIPLLEPARVDVPGLVVSAVRQVIRLRHGLIAR